jgi:hypothetical protein
MENSNKSLEETLIEQGIDKEIFVEYGLELAHKAYISIKFKSIFPRGNSKRRDALEISNNILIGLYTLLTSKTLDSYSIYHIIITNSQEDLSKTTLEEAYGAMCTVGEKVKGMKTFIIGIDLNTNANTEMLQLTKAGGEDVIYYNIHEDEIDDIFEIMKSTILTQVNLNAPMPGRRRPDSKVYRVLLFTIDIADSMKGNWSKITQNIGKIIDKLEREDLIGGVLFNEKIYIAGNIDAEGDQQSFKKTNLPPPDGCAKKVRTFFCSKRVQISIIIVIIIALLIFIIVKAVQADKQMVTG